MCEPLLLKAAFHDGSYDFSPVFQNVSGLFGDSDYVIGNLETPLAGEGAGYTDNLFSFNTPDAFADAVRQAGIRTVLTANNHCLDRGTEGLKRTVRVLREKDLHPAGAFETSEDRKEAEYFQVGTTRVAVVSYTYGTNYAANHIRLEGKDQSLVNLLRPQDELYYVREKPVKRTITTRVFNRFLRLFSEEKRYYIKKFLGMQYNTPHADDSLNKETAAPYIARMREDIGKAKENADLVVFCPHIGGQFNTEPGQFSEYVFNEAVQAGCDMIVASHAHVVLKAEHINGVPCFYSVGNFSMSPNSVYLLRENLPDYGLAVHFYVEKKHIQKVTFSILKIVEKKGQYLSVYPANYYIDSLSDKDEVKKVQCEIKQIYGKVTGSKVTELDIKNEYTFS